MTESFEPRLFSPDTEIFGRMSHQEAMFLQLIDKVPTSVSRCILEDHTPDFRGPRALGVPDEDIKKISPELAEEIWVNFGGIRSEELGTLLHNRRQEFDEKVTIERSLSLCRQKGIQVDPKVLEDYDLRLIIPDNSTEVSLVRRFSNLFIELSRGLNNCVLSISESSSEWGNLRVLASHDVNGNFLSNHSL